MPCFRTHAVLVPTQTTLSSPEAATDVLSISSPKSAFGLSHFSRLFPAALPETQGCYAAFSQVLHAIAADPRNRSAVQYAQPGNVAMLGLDRACNPTISSLTVSSMTCSNHIKAEILCPNDPVVLQYFSSL